MTIVKNLLLGTVAGLVTVAGAQAADMPVKAKPVQYVKICSLYGDGFYYIPGTDTCLKMGGYLRVQAEYNMGGGGVPLGSGAAEAAQARQHPRSHQRLQLPQPRRDLVGRAPADRVRHAAHLHPHRHPGHDPGRYRGGAVFWDRAFMQFAGFTVGKTQSFFDLFSFGGAYSYHNARTDGDTGAAGVDRVGLHGPVRQRLLRHALGGESAGPQPAGAADLNAAGFFGANGAAVNDAAFAVNAGGNGFRMPDVIGNLRVDEKWGFAGVSVVLHDASGAYYRRRQQRQQRPSRRQARLGSCGGRQAEPARRRHGGHQRGLQRRRGRLRDQGRRPGRDLRRQHQRRIWLGHRRSVRERDPGRAHPRVEHQRGVRASSGTRSGGRQLVRRLRQRSYNDTSNEHHDTCRSAPTPGRERCGAASRRSLSTGEGNCSPDFSFYQVGPRTQWNPVSQLEIGLETMYTRLNTAFKGAANVAATGSRPAVTSIDDQGVWSAFVRWQRNFYP